MTYTIHGINFNETRPGYQAGVVQFPVTTDRAGYGQVQVPIYVFTGEEHGPTALLISGVHGDEYEGQIVLRKMIADMDSDYIKAGRIIIIPSLNMPACLAGTRTSPLDGLDLNRVCPGNPIGSITQRIAHFLCDLAVVKTQVTYCLDIHSGGKSLKFAPHVAYHMNESELHWLEGEQTLNQTAARRMDFALSFTPMPYIVNAQEHNPHGTLDHMMETAGKVFCYMELPGGEPSNLNIQQALGSIEVALHRKGILKHKTDRGQHFERLTHQSDDREQLHLKNSMILSHCLPYTGLLELRVQPGDIVHSKGMELGDIHTILNLSSVARGNLPSGSNVPYIQPSCKVYGPMSYSDNHKSYVVLATHNGGPIQPGDTIAVLAEIDAQ